MLGEGAMGEVYLAEHVQLRHLVAIKFLKESLLQGERARARFRREAEVAAGLDSPSICNVIDFGEHEGRIYLVMSYCKGPDLKHVLASGPLPPIPAVLYSIQIAEGLEVAHRRGIVHRDLKPSNIVIACAASDETQPCVDSEAPTAPITTKATGNSSTAGYGQARIIDFGLALLPDVSQVTQTGELLGTPAYMAPEQMLGERVDQRADLWALGAILYEMVVGRPAFGGNSLAVVRETIRSVDPPGLSEVRPPLPTKLVWIVRKALRKQAGARYQDAAEMLVDLRSLLADLDRGSAVHKPTWIVENIRWLRWVSVCVVLIAVVAVGLWFVRTAGQNHDPVPVGRPSPVTLGVAWEGEPDLSPDGSRVVYASGEGCQFDIFVVPATGGRALRITDHAAHDCSPAWFPDGDAIAYVSNRLGSESIWKTSQHGGGATLLLENASDPAVSPDGKTLAFSRRYASFEGRIGVVPVADPDAVRMLTLGPEHGLWNHRDPAWSHDGRRICYSAKNNLWLVDLASGMVRKLTHGGREDRSPAWSPDDSHVYFSSMRDNLPALWRVRVRDGHTARLTLGGGAERHPSVAASGKRLAFQALVVRGSDLAVFDRDTGNENLMSGEDVKSFPSLSPDGRLLAFVSDRWGDSAQIWLQELEAGVMRGPARRLTEQTGHASHPAISPDGRWVAYYRFDASERDLWIVPAAGGAPRKLTTHPASDLQPSWSPDASRLAFVSDREGTFTIWVMPMNGGFRAGEPIRVTPPDLEAFRPIWSPDGTRLAFCARGEVWLVTATGESAPRQITLGARADRLRWLADLDEIWISGMWDEGCYSLRSLSPEGGEPQPLNPRHGTENPDQEFFFDVSGDGRILVFTKQHSQARVWLLEATEGGF